MSTPFEDDAFRATHANALYYTVEDFSFRSARGFEYGAIA